MADWTYSDYITYTDATAMYARRALHIQEVSDKLTAELASDSYSKSTQVLERYLANLKKEHAGDTSGSTQRTNGGVSVARLTGRARVNR